ncbi:MAG: helix-turn-helix domain-containing protein [Phycisphaeraceae bacterium JB051]
MAQLPILEPSSEPPFWSVWSYGHDTKMPSEKYNWSNHDRGPHHCLCIQYNIRGSINYVERGQKFVVKQEQAFVFSYMEDTRYYLEPGRDEEYECIWLNLSGAGLREHWHYLRQQFGSILTIDPKSSTMRTFNQIYDMAAPKRNTDPYDMASAVNRLVMQIADDLRARWQKTEPPVDQAIEQLLQHPTGTLSLKSIAARFDVSREHLTRRFVDKMGISPGQYLIQQKLQRALILLKETNLPITQVAEQSGFGTSHTLIRQMQTTHGMSPTEYRQKQHA